jgi:hypothetical protein
MPILEAFALLPEFAAAGEAALGVEAALAAGAGAAGLFGTEAAGATLGAEALGTAGAAAAVPEAATGINAINPELFASAVNSGAINPATAFNDIPALADKLANLPAGQNLFDTNALAEANNFGTSQMANQGIMGANPYAQITASNTSGPMAANPLPAAGTPVPASPPPSAPPTAPAAPGGSYVEATGSPNPEYFRSPTLTPTEPPGFLDKLSDTFSPLQKGFEKAQEFAKKNPLITGIASTIASRMANSGNSMPDTTYNGPLSKFKLSKDFQGRQVNPADYRYRRASGGIIDYKEGGTTEPLAHADMGIVVDTDPETRYLNPLDAAKKRNKKLRDRYGISIPEMQAPTPINDGTQSAAHGGIMQVKRFVEGEGVGDGPDPNAGEGGVGGLGTNAGEQPSTGNGGGDPNTAGGNYAPNMASMADEETGGGANKPNTGGNVAGTRGTGLFGSGPGGLFGPVNTGGLSGYVDPSGARYGGFDGGGYGGDSGGGGDTTTPIKTPVTNIDDLKPQFVNPEMYRPVTNPLAHYAKYDNEDYNYLRTPSMAVRSSPFNNNAIAEVLATVNKAKGGDINSYAQGGMSSLGGYARGGMPRLLDGPGDGMSDNIPATINDRQPARLADGEFVVPADVVSHLGNGSTKAGSQRLHLMMDQVRKARTGNPKQGKRINPDKFMPR